MRSKPLKGAGKPSRPHPYSRANMISSAANSWPTRETTPLPDLPPPSPSVDRAMSAIGFLEGRMKLKFPGFLWKSDMDIVAASSYQAPMDHATLRMRIDDDLNRIFRMPWQSRERAIAALHGPALSLRANPRSHVLAVKPFVDQQIRTRPIPSCPSISVRLWTSSPTLKLFSMDFVETATGVSVDVSDRFKCYGGGYMMGGGPTRPMRALAAQKKPHGECFEEETYILHECQTVTIEDTKSKHKGADRFLSFEVPKHPAGVPTYPVSTGHITSFSFDA